MFPSNLVQQLPSSIHVVPPSSSTSPFDLEKDGVHFNHHHHHHHHNNQFVNGDCHFHAHNTLASPVFSENIMVRQQQLFEGSGFNYTNDHNNLLEAVICPLKKKPTNIKKDGHSKIHTAQGPRDRRVRMSIEVARKFFYLQDLLGFDKASKTLDWLFNKSKTAIKELVEEMKHCSSPGATDQCEAVFQDTLKRRSDDEDKGQKKKSVPKFVDAKKKRKYRSVVDVNQSRAEARARARERTKEKLQNKKLESKKEYNERGSRESVMEPKIPMSSSVVYGYNQHNVLVSNDLSSQIKYTSFLNLHN